MVSRKLAFSLSYILVIANAALLNAQSFPEAGSSSSENTVEDILQNQSQNKQVEQLQLPKETSGLYSDSYVDPKTYHVGPFDVFYLSIWQPVNVATLLTVTPEGMLVVPRIGEFNAKGKTLDSLRREVLADLAKRINKNVQASLTLYKPRNILVYVTGNVKQPGSFLVSGNSRASLAIQLANQTPKDETPQPFEIEKKEREKEKEKNQRALFGTQSAMEYSLREIVVRHNDGTSDRVDLLKYNATHDDAANPMLREGDQIFVPRRDPQTISIYGAVNQPGAYEFVKGDSLTSLVAIAYGLTQNADLSDVRLEHVDVNGTVTKSEHVNFEDIQNKKSADIALEPGDGVIIEQNIVRNYFGAVAVTGEVPHPGTYGIAPGHTTLSEVIKREGGFTAEADTANGYVLRRITGADGKPADLYNQSQQMYKSSPLTLEDTLNFDLQSRLRSGSVAVDFRKLFIEGNASADIVLQDGDEIVVQKNLHQVYVYGHVHNSGYVTYIPGKSAAYYVAKAGGEEESASGKIGVIRGNTYAWEDGGDANIRNGDLVYVPKTPDLPVSAKQQETANILTGLLVVATFASIVVNYILFHK